MSIAPKPPQDPPNPLAAPHRKAFVGPRPETARFAAALARTRDERPPDPLGGTAKSGREPRPGAERALGVPPATRDADERPAQLVDRASSKTLTSRRKAPATPDRQATRPHSVSRADHGIRRETPADELIAAGSIVLLPALSLPARATPALQPAPNLADPTEQAQLARFSAAIAEPHAREPAEAISVHFRRADALVSSALVERTPQNGLSVTLVPNGPEAIRRSAMLAAGLDRRLRRYGLSETILLVRNDLDENSAVDPLSD